MLPDLPGSVGALSAALLGSALDVAGLAVIITDAALDPPGPSIRYANAHFEAITGYPAAELLGQTPRILQGPGTDQAELDRLRRDLRERRHFIGATLNYRRNGEAYRNQWVVLPILGLDGAVTHWLSIQRDVTREGQPHTGAEALRQRTEALLGSIRAIAARTLTAPEEERAFGGRLAALGRAQRLAGADLSALVRGEVEPLRHPGAAARTGGPPVSLPPGIAEPLALALHELAAHSARQGALASPEGDLSITWALEGEGPERHLRLRWAERGGTPPGGAWPMIEEALVFALGGHARLGTEDGGLTCAIRLPLGG
ncbi:PAS domain-containing protein [Roseomonas sp. SSH11]|uniref:histidine kinase n=1 Tax=Pararoseomonas baculiformis TaxID=2820812 RepID=A0ABS4ACB9_9PROT|nr:PAS domain-containing protein [Pararoseomonas baculiformis]